MATISKQILESLQGAVNRFSLKQIDSTGFLRNVKRLFVKELKAGGKPNYRSGISTSTPIINQVTVRPINRQSQDIQKWRNALMAAEGDTDQRVMLYDLYEDVLLDGYLLDAIDKRVEAITNTDMQFVVDGKPVDDVNVLVQKSFFEEFIKEVMNSKFWGHSLIEIYWPAPGGETGQTSLIPRKHVKPRLGVVTKEQWGTDGIGYRERPWDANLIEVGKDRDLGRLLQAAQYVIYKRGDFGDWAEFAEVFGMPFRWATYQNEPSRVILEEALAAAGSAGYVVAPQDAQLEFLNGNAGGNGTDVFKLLREACNEEISICVLGNTMTTTEAKSSGYAQSYTHRETQDARHKADRRFVLRVLNEKLTPYLERIGYKVSGGHWQFLDEETMPLKDRLEIDLRVAEKVPVPVSYWYDKYKLPVPEEGDDVGEDEEDDDDEMEEEEQAPGKKKA